MIDIEKFIESENPQYFHRHFQTSMAAWNTTTLHIASVIISSIFMYLYSFQRLSCCRARRTISGPFL